MASERLLGMFGAALFTAVLLGSIGWDFWRGQRRVAWLGCSVIGLGLGWLGAIGMACILGRFVGSFPIHLLAWGVILVGWSLLPRSTAP